MRTKEQKAIEMIELLPQFIGTENYYRHYLKCQYTDGVKAMAEIAEAYWLIDLVASWQMDKKVKAEEFQVFELTVNPDNSALVLIHDGNYNEIGRQEIEYSDFPIDEFKLYFVDHTILLPSEY